jgi:ATP-dependent DNA ligase
VPAFIPPMLCERLADPARLADRRYIAEPKLDGQRAQLPSTEAARSPASAA